MSLAIRRYDETDDLVVRVKELVPSASALVINRLSQAGLSERQIVRCAGFCQRYKTNLPAIYRWHALECMDLDDIEQCLQLRQDIGGRYVSSVRLLHRILSAVNFQTVSLEDVFDTFVGPMEGNKRFPLHFLLHRIDLMFDGDFMYAYHVACDHPQLFAMMMRGQADLLTCGMAMLGAFDHDADQDDIWNAIQFEGGQSSD